MESQQHGRVDGKPEKDMGLQPSCGAPFRRMERGRCHDWICSINYAPSIYWESGSCPALRWLLPQGRRHHWGEKRFPEHVRALLTMNAKEVKTKKHNKQKTRRREEGCSGQKSRKPLYGLYFAFYLKSSHVSLLPALLLEQQPALWLNRVPRASRRHGTGGLPARCARCWALCSGPSSSWQLLCENWGCVNSS